MRPWSFRTKGVADLYGGVHMQNGTWKSQMSHELRQLLREPTIVHTVKIGNSQWAGHVIRIPGSNPIKMAPESHTTCTRTVDTQALV